MKKIKDILIIGEPMQGAPPKCSECGKKFDADDLRPYGRGGAWVCYDCGMNPKNKSIVEKNVKKIITGRKR